METLQRILSNKLVAVIRGAQGKQVLGIAEALKKGGVDILEITADTPNVYSLINELKETWGDEIVVGAGTVLDPNTAQSAIQAGAAFIFSPTLNEETIKVTKRYGKVSIPGALTPTEILRAYECGADLVKVFPADVVGPNYFKSMRGPLPQIPLMPTGGVNLDNIQDYLANGAVAVGLGGSLVNTKKTMDDAVLEEITKQAKQFVEKVKEV